MTKYQEAAERLEEAVFVVLRAVDRPMFAQLTVVFPLSAPVADDIGDLWSDGCPYKVGSCEIVGDRLLCTVEYREVVVETDPTIVQPEVRSHAVVTRAMARGTIAGMGADNVGIVAAFGGVT